VTQTQFFQYSLSCRVQTNITSQMWPSGGKGGDVYWRSTALKVEVRARCLLVQTTLSAVYTTTINNIS